MHPVDVAELPKRVRAAILSELQKCANQCIACTDCADSVTFGIDDLNLVIPDACNGLTVVYQGREQPSGSDLRNLCVPVDRFEFTVISSVALKPDCPECPQLAVECSEWLTLAVRGLDSTNMGVDLRLLRVTPLRPQLVRTCQVYRVNFVIG